MWHFTTEACPPTGDPSNLAGTGVSATQIDLTRWDNSSAETSFRVERSQAGSTGGTETATLGADVESYQDGGLSCSTSFYYRVCAHRGSDGYFSDYTGPVSASSQGCGVYLPLVIGNN